MILIYVKNIYIIVNHMMYTGYDVLEQNNANMNNVEFGYHKSIITSVKHLHLHCLGLPYKSCWTEFQYKSLFFITHTKLIEKLNKLNK